jgi:hypothetical protein
MDRDLGGAIVGTPFRPLSYLDPEDPCNFARERDAPEGDPTGAPVGGTERNLRLT